MKRAPSRFAVLLALGLACGSPHSAEDRLYSDNDLMLVTGYTAHEACSCMFVMDQSEEYCRAWVKANPAVGRFSFDAKTKTVTSAALLLWSRTARYVDENVGCQFDD